MASEGIADIKNGKYVDGGLKIITATALLALGLGLFYIVTKSLSASIQQSSISDSGFSQNEINIISKVKKILSSSAIKKRPQTLRVKVSLLKLVFILFSMNQNC